MNNKYLKILLSAVVLIIVAMVIFENSTDKSDKNQINPFEFNIDEFKSTDSTMISYKETRQITIKDGTPKAIAYNNGIIYILADEYLQAITTQGTEIFKKTIDINPESLTIVTGNNILVAFNDHLVLYDLSAKEIIRSLPASENSKFSSVAVSKDQIFVADAGIREVRIFNKKLIQTGQFKGEPGESTEHGFIVPSAHFCLAVNKDNELWVVNPGLHSVQNYSYAGKLRGYWGKSSIEPEGFSGCCNPFYIAFLSDGNFVTSEKGLVRINIHKPSGELSSIVAPPVSFGEGKKAPAIAVDEKNNIIALDFDKKMIRIYEKTRN